MVLIFLPTLDKLLPLGVFFQVAPKNVICAGWRLDRNVQQVHMHLRQLAPALAVVTARAGGYNIGPDMFPAQVFGQNMVHRQHAGVTPAVLAGVIVPAKDLPAGQLDLQARPVDHLVQPDDGWPRQRLPDGLDGAATVHHHVSFTGEDQANGATSIADINRLEIGV